MTNEEARSELEDALKKIEIIEHALGDKTHYRNHFAAHPEHEDYQRLQELVEAGYMTQGVLVDDIGLEYYHVTKKGRTLAFHGDK